MSETHRGFPIFVLVVSTAVLGLALVSQYWGGLKPCELCLYQRWPWDAAIAIGLIATLVGSRSALPWVALILALAFAVGSALAFYHVGVEQHWFAGPDACTGGNTGAGSVEALKAKILGQAAIRCDEPQWSFFGVSLAGWNLFASLLMAFASLAVILRTRRG
jgi:disulfide bond formation protein DsbB